MVSTQTVSFSAVIMFAVGLLGFFLTLGVILYDLRNSDLYNACVHRAKILEGVMRFVRSGKEGIKPTSPPEEPALLRTVVLLGQAMHNHQAVSAPPERAPLPSVEWPGGVHTQRSRRYFSLLGIPVSHGSALALVYGTLLGAWIFPIAKGSLVLAGGIAHLLMTERTISQGNGFTTSLLAFLLAAAAAYVFRRSLVTTDFGSTVNGLYNDVWKEAKGVEGRETAWHRAATKHAAEAMQAKAIKSLISAVTVSTDPGERLRDRLRLWAASALNLATGTLDLATGQITDIRSSKVAANKKAAAEIAIALSTFTTQIQQATGGTIQGTINIQAGSRDGIKTSYSGPLGHIDAKWGKTDDEENVKQTINQFELAILHNLDGLTPPVHGALDAVNDPTQIAGALSSVGLTWPPTNATQPVSWVWDGKKRGELVRRDGGPPK